MISMLMVGKCNIFHVMDILRILSYNAFKIVVYHFINMLINYLTGAPPEEFLNQAITASDHPFLRANAQSIKTYKMNQRAIGGIIMT